MVLVLALHSAACGDVEEASSSQTSPQCDLSVLADPQNYELASIAPYPGDVQLRPGDSYQFGAMLDQLTRYHPINLCATWAVEPEHQGATIDENGLLVIDDDVLPGTKFTVYAHPDESFGPTLSADVFIYTTSSHPLVGSYREKTQLVCAGTDETPERAIGEVEFRASGYYYVTWLAFHDYVDYMGTYIYDPATTMLQLNDPSGPYVPDGFDGMGTATLEPGAGMTLHNMWLGLHPAVDGEPGCGHVLVAQ